MHEDGRINLVPYDPGWPSVYASVHDRIVARLGDRVLSIHHVGSTSVPGLTAKPVIDVIITVSDPDDEPVYAAPLAADGFHVAVREPDWFAHRCLKADDPFVNLHVFPEPCSEVDRMLSFRDHLRSDATDRDLYRSAKVALAERRWESVQDYADAKSSVVTEIMARAAAGVGGASDPDT